MAWFAAQLKGNRFTDLLDKDGNVRDGFAIFESVPEGVQSHKMLETVAYGYFNSRESAYRALMYNDFPSESRYCSQCGRPKSEPHCGFGESWQ